MFGIKNTNTFSDWSTRSKVLGVATVASGTALAVVAVKEYKAKIPVPPTEAEIEDEVCDPLGELFETEAV